MSGRDHCFDMTVLRSKLSVEKANLKGEQFNGRPSHQRRYTYHADSERKSYTATSHMPRGGRISRRPSWHACTVALTAAGAARPQIVTTPLPPPAQRPSQSTPVPPCT